MTLLTKLCSQPNMSNLCNEVLAYFVGLVDSL